MDNESILGTLSYQTFLAQWKKFLPELRKQRLQQTENNKHIKKPG